MSERSQYEAAVSVPLIKSPSLHVPKPVSQFNNVELSLDIHPLPDNITEYFVYPFTLEPHILTLGTSRRSTLAAHAARHEAYLARREEEKERRKREALRRIAPGFEPTGGTLVPIKVGSGLGQVQGGDGTPPKPKDVMEDLVDQLAALDATSSQQRDSQSLESSSSYL